MRPWEQAATFLTVFDSTGNERLRVSVGQDGVSLRLQNGAGNPPDTDLRVSSVSVTGPGFTRLSFNVVGGQVQLKVNCTLVLPPLTLPAPVDTAAERAFDVNGALVVLGRQGETGLVVSFLSPLPRLSFIFFFSCRRLLLRSKRRRLNLTRAKPSTIVLASSSVQPATHMSRRYQALRVSLCKTSRRVTLFTPIYVLLRARFS